MPDRGDRSAIDLAPGVGRRGLDHHGSGTDGVQLALELRPRAGRVERHDHHTQAEGGKVDVDEVAAVAAQQGDAVALLQAHSGKAPTHMCDLVAQRPVSGGAAAADDGHTVTRVWIDDGREIHGTWPSCGGDAKPLRSASGR